jgi:hypothetical protein
MLHGMTDAKTYAERMVELVLTPDQFDMSSFDGGRARAACGTACCIAGNGGIAGFELGLTAGLAYGSGLAYQCRTAWASVYGEASADLLSFYNTPRDCEAATREINSRVFARYSEEEAAARNEQYGESIYDEGDAKDLEDVTPLEAALHILECLEASPKATLTEIANIERMIASAEVEALRAAR